MTTLEFAWLHRHDDTARLLLGKAPEGVDMRLVAQQIEGWQTARQKWPSLAANPHVLYPPRLNREQASSEATAAYKAALVSEKCRMMNEELPTANHSSFLNPHSSLDNHSSFLTPHSSLENNSSFLTPHSSLENNSSFLTPHSSLDNHSSFLIPHSSLKFADLTGGMGIDTLALASINSINSINSITSPQVDYFELDPNLCSLMRHNCDTLGIKNITVHNCDSLTHSSHSSYPTPYDFALIDPARRDSAGRRVAAFEDCKPDILTAMPHLRSLCRLLMVKASPMVDISLAMSQLAPIVELHVVALRGECKELLFLIDSMGFVGETTVHCVNLQGPSSAFVFRPSEARSATAPLHDPAVPPRYLFEPDATIMKAGCHSLVCARFGLAMLSHNSHVYSSMQLVDNFPGRCFEVIAEVAPTRRALAPLLPDWKVNIISRNHPLSADALRRQLRLSDGGDKYLIATTLATRPTAYLCRRIMSA